jgi:mitogen-activated protein kinase 15
MATFRVSSGALVAGCILGELLMGKPIFPGTSTMNQIDRIIEVTGRPGKEDLEAIQSPFAATMMEGCSVMQAKKIQEVFPSANEEAADLLIKLLQFNPYKRLTAEQALQHPYVAQFHNPADEPSAPRPILIPINDNHKYTINEYRDRLYAEIVRRKKELRKKMKEREARLAREARHAQRRFMQSSQPHHQQHVHNEIEQVMH